MSLSATCVWFTQSAFSPITRPLLPTPPPTLKLKELVLLPLVRMLLLAAPLVPVPVTVPPLRPTPHRTRHPMIGH
jgi:hypothetical protein